MEDDFTPLEQAAWGGLLGMYGRLFRLIDTDLQTHSQITHIEFEVLLRLTWEKNQRMRIQDLAARSVLTRSGVSRVVERLEKIGLIRRERADEDRRGAYAILTADGAARLKTALTAHVAFVRQHFLTHFSEAELKQMGLFWQRLDAVGKDSVEE
ncbi:MAG: MarR family winged helix-turn-helix transcriptional regulator [Chloroflexota bacterium]|nr:MarR family winged helix-turn-helix transcriptional regulator [Chloroflexota bacterium]